MLKTCVYIYIYIYIYICIHTYTYIHISCRADWVRKPRRRVSGVEPRSSTPKGAYYHITIALYVIIIISISVIAIITMIITYYYSYY